MLELNLASGIANIMPLGQAIIGLTRDTVGILAVDLVNILGSADAAAVGLRENIFCACWAGKRDDLILIGSL